VLPLSPQTSLPHAAAVNPLFGASAANNHSRPVTGVMSQANAGASLRPE
jgi:hypothetical protein